MPTTIKTLEDRPPQPMRLACSEPTRAVARRHPRRFAPRFAFYPAPRVAWRWAVVLLAVLVLPALSAPQAWAQKQSVKPGINKPFEGENTPVERFIKIFEAESRDVYRYRHAIVAVLDLEPGMHVADVGAGTGLFTRLISDLVGPEGRVYAVDISRGFLEHIRREAESSDRKNVVPVLCEPRDVKLQPESVDRAFVCDTYHHFEFPQDTLASIHRALRPDGELLVVDFERIQGVSPAWVLGHVRCGKGTVTDEIKDAGFELVADIPLMDSQYVLRFRKRPPKPKKAKKP